MDPVCGRFQLGVPEDWLEDMGLTEAPDLPARYNIAPSQDVAIVRQEGTGRRASLARWGLVPPWAKDPKVGNRLINARSETLTRKPAFREAFAQRRCLVPAQAFYEWQRQGKEKQPWRVARKDGRPFGFAGLWERWRGPAGPLTSCTIVTTAANGLVAPIHSRMPAVLAPEQYALWLDPEAPAETLLSLLQPFSEELLLAHPVSSRVNRPDVDDEACALPVSEHGTKHRPVQTTLW
jgi:putative SOS response-associated peptidase YedK